MSVRLLKAQRVDGMDQQIVATYVVEHSNKNSTLDMEMVVTIDSIRGVSAAMRVKSPKCGDPEDAVDVLAERLERMAEALRKRRRDGKSFPLSLPLYEDRATEGNIKITNENEGNRTP